MSDPKLKGDLNAIKLWYLMASSNDEKEKEYMTKLNSAALQYGKVWFTDIITERETGEAQTTWMMEWRPDSYEWEFSKFLQPSGAEEVTDRIKKFEISEEVNEIDTDDLVECE